MIDPTNTEAAGGYLFATFKGEATPMTEQIYLALSRDGHVWHALNGGKPVLVSREGDKGIRDPFLVRSRLDNKFHLLATDLSVHLHPDWKRAVRAGSRSLVMWDSDDLLHWSEPRYLPLAVEDAGCAWAPETVYDEEAGDYLVFWASTSAADNFTKHRIWAARTTDFHHFGEPFLYIDKPVSVIDTTIVRDGDHYYRFSKDEEHAAITQEVSEKLMGPWRAIPEFSLAHLTGYEGPQCFQLHPPASGAPDNWCLILDHYAWGAGYQPYVTADLATGQFAPGRDFTFPYHFRHGSVLPITDEEYARLAAGG